MSVDSRAHAMPYVEYVCSGDGEWMFTVPSLGIMGSAPSAVEAERFAARAVASCEAATRPRRGALATRSRRR